MPTKLGIVKWHTENEAFAFQGQDLVWVPPQNNSNGISVSSMQSIGISSPYSLSCSFWDKNMVWEGKVPKNVKAC
jgi:hypothetical protein